MALSLGAPEAARKAEVLRAAGDCMYSRGQCSLDSPGYQNCRSLPWGVPMEEGFTKPTVNETLFLRMFPGSWVQLGNQKNLTCFGGTFEMLLNMLFPVEGSQTAVIISLQKR